MTTIIILIALAICLSDFYLMAMVKNYYFRLLLGVILSFTVTFVITFAILFDQLKLVFPIFFYIMLIEIVDLKLKIKSNQLKIKQCMQFIEILNREKPGVKEGLVKDYIIRVLDNDNETLEVITQRINERFYVISADSREKALERYKDLHH